MTPHWRVRWIRLYIAFRHGLERKWEIIRDDPIAWTEIASGGFLVALRGLIFALGTAVNMPHDVTRLLQSAHITEDRWATYLMVCGVLQIIFAGTRHSLARLLVTFAIMVGFALMVAGFVLSAIIRPPDGEPSLIASLVCMMAFYTILLARVIHDRDASHRPEVERRHAH